jgi:Ca2+-binding RTX toxin-like protein
MDGFGANPDYRASATFRCIHHPGAFLRQMMPPTSMALRRQWRHASLWPIYPPVERDMPIEPTTTWEFLEDSYWYVPTPYLAAFALVSGGQQATVPLVDQTLWHITGVVDGYVFGEVATTLGNGWVYSTLVGSITPTGAVSFSFTQQDGSADLTEGQGTMVEDHGEWYFEMQMTTGSGSASVTHWAYMAEAQPGDRAWQALPGFTSTGIAAAFDDDMSNDAGASEPQRVVIGTDGDDQPGRLVSKFGLLLFGEGGSDMLEGGSKADGLVGGSGNDRLNGRHGADDLYGQSGADRLAGGSGADLLSGGAGRDKLAGGDGNDVIFGDAGKDILDGGAGSDRFVFDVTDQSRPGHPDLILDFAAGDRIDLSTMDSHSRSGGKVLDFIGMSAFSGASGELRYEATAARTAVHADLDGDGSADFAISLSGHHRLVASDFLL